MALPETIRRVDAVVAAHDKNAECFSHCEALMKELDSTFAKGWSRIELKRLSALKDVAQFTYDLERQRMRTRRAQKAGKHVHSILEEGYVALAHFSSIITEYRLPAIVIGGETAETWLEVASLAHEAANSVAEELRTDPKFLLQTLAARQPTFRD